MVNSRLCLLGVKIMVAAMLAQNCWIPAALSQIATKRSDDPAWDQQQLQKLTNGFGFTEGPALNDRGTVFFTDMTRNLILAVDSGGKLWQISEDSGGANGLAFDLKHRLLACQQSNNRVVRYEDDGTVTVLADSFEGKKLNNPNDLCVAPDGSVFFTDPSFGGSRYQPVCGVYRIAPDGKIERVLSDLLSPNGIALNPDGRILYAGDTATGV
ncbi:MAG: SMP-30/gluconolactonase/LRE family protein, partial [Candidatus Omnitrophota bacterium]